MADFTYTINQAGGSHPTYSDFASAKADFLANDRCGGGAGVVPSGSTLYFKFTGWHTAIGGFTVSGITVTSASWPAIVIEASANPWNASTANAATYSSSFDGVQLSSLEQIVVDNNKTLVRNLIIDCNLSGNFTGIINYWASGRQIEFQNLIVRNRSTGTNGGCIGAIGGVRVANCYAIHTGTNTGLFGIDLSNSGAAVPSIENCTVIVPSTTSSKGFADTAGSGVAAVVKNTYASGTTPYGGLTFSGSSIGNASSASDAPGSGALSSIALSTTNFISVTGAGDYKVASGSTMKTTGAARLASTLTDAYGQSRSSTTTIGAYAAEVGGGGGSTVPIHLLRTLQIP